MKNAVYDTDGQTDLLVAANQLLGLKKSLKILNRLATSVS